jgi:hypothetical protein
VFRTAWLSYGDPSLQKVNSTDGIRTTGTSRTTESISEITLIVPDIRINGDHISGSFIQLTEVLSSVARIVNLTSSNNSD